MTSAAPARRPAARVLLLDPADRVLLLPGRDPQCPTAGRWWFTPGGGLLAGESPVAGALRELAEETGVVLPADRLVGPVWRRSSRFTFAGRRYHQEEAFFLARLAGPVAVHTRGFTADERRYVGAPRWWPLAELRATDETVYPPGLGDLLADLLNRLGSPAAAAAWEGPPRWLD